jgi:ribose 5-phosphate isomerase
MQKDGYRLTMNPVRSWRLIDGADEVERNSIGLIERRGGALLREKIVAAVGN